MQSSSSIQEEKYQISNQYQTRRISRKFGIKSLSLIPLHINENLKENYALQERVKTEKDLEFLKSCLKDHFLFFNLSQEHLQRIFHQMFYCSVEQGNFIFQQGDEGLSFFLLEQGSFELTINDKIVQNVSPGHSFGQLALLYNAPRSGSLKAVEKSFLWGIDRNQFKYLVEDINRREFQETLEFLKSVSFFNLFTQQQLSSIAGVFIVQKFSQGEVIVRQNDQASSFYCIKKGKCSVRQDGEIVNILKERQSFGESALLSDESERISTVVAEEDTFCLAIGRQMFTHILGDDVEKIIFSNQIKWKLETLEGFKQFQLQVLENILGCLEIRHMKHSQKIIQQGELQENQLIFLEMGEFMWESEQSVVQQGTVLGTHALLQKETKKYQQDLIVISEQSVIGMLLLSKIEQIFGSSLETALQQKQLILQIKDSQDYQEKSPIPREIQFDDLQYLQYLGQGQFGNVFLVSQKKKFKQYALQCLSQKVVIEQKMEQFVQINHIDKSFFVELKQDEQIAMEQLDFPFIMKFLRSFQDENFVYFLLEYIQGEELFDVLRKLGNLNIQYSLFLTASLILTTEYLHKNLIIYRDIQPENIMIGMDGNLKLIDFGTVKIMKTNLGVTTRTFTLIGTPNYMAPEVINGKGYTFYIDLWSIGICLYQFLCGATPYGEDTEDPFEIYQQILKQKLEFPQFITENPIKSFINQLLNKTPQMRLGSSFKTLKSHQVFEGFDWEKLERKEMVPFYKPEPRPKLAFEKSETESQESITQAIQREMNFVPSSKTPISKIQNWDQIF